MLIFLLENCETLKSFTTLILPASEAKASTALVSTIKGKATSDLVRRLVIRKDYLLPWGKKSIAIERTML